MERGLEIKMKRAPGGKREAGLATGGGAWSGLEGMNGEEESREEPQPGHFILRSVLYIIREGEGRGEKAKRRDLSSGQTEPGPWEGRMRPGRAAGRGCGGDRNLSAPRIWGGGCSGTDCDSKQPPPILYIYIFPPPRPGSIFSSPVPGSTGLDPPSRELMAEGGGGGCVCWTGCPPA